MSKIEIYNQSRQISQRVKQHYLDASGLKIVDGNIIRNENNDKHHIYCVFRELSKADWNDIILDLRLSHGYYGSSSGYSDTCEDTGKYVAQAITIMGTLILKQASQLAENDTEKARLEAENEAKMVLQETSS